MAGPWEDFKDQGPWVDYQQLTHTPTAPADMGATLTKMAAYPAEQVGKIPYVGGVLSNLVPSTPAGWGATTAVAAASPFIGPAAGWVPTALRGAAAVIGGTGGSLLGGSTPGEAAIAGAKEGVGQVGGEKVLGFVGKQIKGFMSPIINRYGKALAQFIPGIATDKPDATWFFNVVRGGEGNKALSQAFENGKDKILQTVGQDAVIQNPVITEVVKKYKSFLPSAQGALGEIPSGVAGTPAHLVLKPNATAMTVDTAMTLAQEMGQAARKISPKDPQAIRMKAAEIKIKEAVAAELDNKVGGLGQAYKSIQDSYRKGITILNTLEDNADEIFTQKSGGAKINEAALAQAMNDSLSRLRRVGAGELQTAASRGGPPGSGASALKLPTFGMFGGGGGVHGRLSTRPPQLTIYPGQFNNPVLSGYAGQRMADIFNPQE